MTTDNPALVTGASGFVGQALSSHLVSRNHVVRRIVRSARNVNEITIADISALTDWAHALHGVKCVVHLAARAHVVHETTRDVIGAYRHSNVAGTVALAKAAAQQGVRRFVFVSSVKVNGEQTTTQPYNEKDNPQPSDAYGISKYEAEQALWQIARDTGIEVVILRPPLVYGPGVKANFLRLMHLAARGMPLPLAAIENRRSLIYLGNLVDAIAVCMKHSAAPGNTYLVSDDETIGTAELVREISTALCVKSRLFRLPVPLLTLGATLVGRSAEWDRLSGSLQIDSSKIRAELGWRPPFTMAQGLAETAQWYHSRFSVKSNT